MPKIITFTGASGTGKSTLAKELLNNPHFSLITSITTRPPRPSDLAGEYQYLSLEEFAFRNNQHQFIWKTTYAQNCYGTTFASIDKASAASVGEYSIMILVPEVVPILVEYVGKNIVQHFFIKSPPLPILKERMQRRGDSPETIEHRLHDVEQWESNALNSGVEYLLLDNDQEVNDTLKWIYHKLKP